VSLEQQMKELTKVNFKLTDSVTILTKDNYRLTAYNLELEAKRKISDERTADIEKRIGLLADENLS
jgi:hypothetical protein